MSVMELRRSVLNLAKRLGKSSLHQQSAAASTFNFETYKCENEPIFDYLPGSPERVELEKKLEFYSSQATDVPVVIGDEEIRTGKKVKQVMPFDHQKTLANFYYADEAQIQKAIDVSLKARADWEYVPLAKRAEIFEKAADLCAGKYRQDLMATTMLGQGKTIIQGEIDTTCELIDFYRFDIQYASEMVKYNPISTSISKNTMEMRGMEGFWAAIAPFNFTAIGGHLAGAPAMMGNSVLFKPSDTSVLSAYVVYKILREAGVPAGVINFVPADGPTFGNTVTKSTHLAGINFTGSTGTFHTLWKNVADNIENYVSYPRLIGECGGKNYHLLHPSGDAQSLVNGTIRSGFEYGGQKCSAVSRIYVPSSKWAEVKEGLIAKQKSLKLGSVRDADTFLSAIIDDKAFDRVKSYVDYAKNSAGNSIVAGGNCDNSVGYFIEPTIIECKDPRDKLMQEEIFGPVVSCYVYEDKDFDSMYELINSTSKYALTGAIYSADESVVATARKTLRQTAGNFYINDKSTGSVVCQQPFGGARKSGTNDKSGGPFYLQRFSSPLSVKETFEPLTEVDYPYMKQ